MLEQQADVGEPARDRYAVLGLPGRAQEAELGPGRRRDPGAELECRPVVLGAAEGHHDGRRGSRQDLLSLPGDEDADVTRGSRSPVHDVGRRRRRGSA